MFLIIDIYRLGVVYPYLSTSISLDECDYYRYISHIIINVINNDEEIYIAIYLPKKFPDVNNLILGGKNTIRKVIPELTYTQARKQLNNHSFLYIEQLTFLDGSNY